MKERICSVLVFFSCTTAPATGASSPRDTTPCTLRVWASPFFGFFSCATAAPLSRSNAMSAQIHRMALPPVLIRLFFFLFQKLLVFFLVLFHFVRRLQFQRLGAHHLQIRAALIATDGVAFVDVFFIDVDLAIAHRAFNHR